MVDIPLLAAGGQECVLSYNMSVIMETAKLNPKFFLTVVLSGWLTAVTSVVYIVLCIIALIYRSICSAGNLSYKGGSQYFLATVFRVYIQNADCSNSLKYPDITQSQTVFIMTIIILTFAVFHLCSAIALITVAYQEYGKYNMKIYSYIYIGISLAVIIVDITLGIHLAIDINTIRKLMDNSSPGLGINYEMDMIRLGALLLMTISFKGYVIHIINIVLLILLAMYAAKQHHDNKNQHVIHNLGVLNAFEHTKRIEDPWPVHNDMFFTRGTHNIGEDPQRHKALSDTSSRPHDRSNSWHHSQAGPGLGSRPFSYLEEPKRPVAVRPPVPPNKPESSHQNWKRDPWPQGPYVPDPDYSPQPRRLKSALKTGYS